MEVYGQGRMVIASHENRLAYVWRLCVEIMCGDYVFVCVCVYVRLCVWVS